MATNGSTNGVSHTDRASKPNGVSATQGITETNGVPQSNGTTHNLAAKGHSRKPSSYAAKHKLAPHFIGGNHLGVAPASSVKDFVANHDGHTVISSVSQSFSLPGREPADK